MKERQRNENRPAYSEMRKMKGQVRKMFRNEGRTGYKKSRVGWILEELG